MEEQKGRRSQPWLLPSVNAFTFPLSWDSALCPGFPTDLSEKKRKEEKSVSDNIYLYWIPTFSFLFFLLLYTADKRSWFLLHWDGKERISWSRPEDELDGGNTKLLLPLTLSRSLTHHFIIILAFQALPVYSDWSWSCITGGALHRSPLAPPLWRQLKRSPEMKYSAWLSCFRVDDLLPQSLDFINK